MSRLIEKKTYVCPYCLSEYPEVEQFIKGRDCVESHIEPKKIVNNPYNKYNKGCKYPHKLMIEFEDGKQIEFNIQQKVCQCCFEEAAVEGGSLCKECQESCEDNCVESIEDLIDGIKDTGGLKIEL